ncbi:alpha/beta fold hydrolase [Yoonia sp. F2084L]|uniref:alpha/beta hydrolase n=1 Tax=Yoonia sp. F2084L TaxID=2926419 RepID=UPI001FF21A9A|nr:alpha/beta fold hydrolase [Yoonia sp. F2084L]MCK0096295.1 alpha/beta fold hydrolase [Yoonia sp. F2084L]
MHDLADIEAALAAAEAQVPHLREGCEKRIVWAGAPATKTPICLLYIHGFSATGEELRPLPDLVAKELGANIHFTRLTGHGQDGDAMGKATLSDWRRDVAEAIVIAETLGDEVIIMGCSTGCTLATLALAEGAKAKVMIHVSPNFGLRHRAVQTLLDLPGSRHWSKYIAGRSRSFEPINQAHAAYWTVKYPTDAVHVMADAVRAVRGADLTLISTPALFCFNEADQVVHPEDTQKVIARWGAATEQIKIEQTPDDDAMGHVMAGDIFSPGQNAPLARQILAWLRGLPAR